MIKKTQDVIVKRIKGRMASNYQDGSRVTNTTARFVIPKSYQTASDCKALFEISDCHLFISNSQLARLLELVKCEPGVSPNSMRLNRAGMNTRGRSLSSQNIEVTGYRGCYIRCFTMTIREFLDLVEEWERADEDVPSEFLKWREQVYEYLKKPGHSLDDTITLRYIGKCSAEDSPPLGRLAEDLQRNNGTYAKFGTGLGNLNMRDKFENPDIYVFWSSFIDEVNANMQHIDLAEEIAIAFFGLANLINRQSGGNVPKFLPSNEHHHLFLKGRTGFADIMQGGREIPDDMKDQLANHWWARIEEVAAEFPEQTGTNKYPFHRNYKSMCISQATPLYYDSIDSVLAVFIGKDITFE
ncbi:hypothetical protein HDU76_010744, partial [Blyttiomyces sp. JEL0837]